MKGLSVGFVAKQGSDPGSIPLVAVELSWENYLTFLSLSFLSFKMGMKIPNSCTSNSG